MIVLNNVSYTYPHTVQAALHHLSLSLPKGQCIMITGTFRCRKTTLCLAACGILHHEYGGKRRAGSLLATGMSWIITACQT